MAPGKLRFGCVGGLLFGIAVVLAVYGLLAPWSYRIGGRFTPLMRWEGVGRLRDSAGHSYGLYVSFYPWLRGGASRIGNAPRPRTSLRGTALVCTAAGTKYPFRLSGEMDGAWLRTDGAEIHFTLAEPRTSGIRRHFSLHGIWNGPELPLDDHKSMFMYFLQDGTLTPSRSYTSPVPEKHATATLSWGGEGDFESLCKTLQSR